MADKNNCQERSIPPPKDPYARFQTPYDKPQSAEDESNPFIEFRKFADASVSSIFSSLPRAFGFDQYYNEKVNNHNAAEKDILDVLSKLEENLQEKLKPENMFGKWPSPRSHQERDIEVPPAPEGWKVKVDPWGRTWYKNKETGLMTTRRPATPIKAAEEAQPPVLPPGWERASTLSGVYYIHPESGRATKDAPTSDIPSYNRNDDSNSTAFASSAVSDFIREQVDHRPWSQQEKSAWQGFVDAATTAENSSPEEEQRVVDNFNTLRRGSQKCPAWPRASDESCLPTASPAPREQRQDGTTQAPKATEQYPDTELDMYQSKALGHDGRRLMKSLRRADIRSDDRKPAAPVLRELALRHLPWTDPWSMMGDLHRDHYKIMDRFNGEWTDTHTGHVQKPVDDCPRSELSDGDYSNILKYLSDSTKEAQGRVDKATQADSRRLMQQTCITADNIPEEQLTNKTTPSIIKQINNRTSRRLPDNTLEVKREIRKIFSDGKEEVTTSTSVIPATDSVPRQKHQGWFWN